MGHGRPQSLPFDVLQSYQRTLIAKVQLQEFIGWGLGDSFRTRIAEHEELERRYVAGVIRRRQEKDQAERESGTIGKGRRPEDPQG